MIIPKLHSAQRIEHQFHTGESPVLVMCSDVNVYVCKYMRSSNVAYKMACEFVGAHLGMTWQLRTPKVALVNIKPEHWEGIDLPHSITAPAIGSLWLDNVIDINTSTFATIPAKRETLYELIKIALFDFWISNEDRNANNANLMYDVTDGNLVSIDYGCIFNTATFEYPVAQLTSTDTILCSDLFQHLSNGYKNDIHSLAEDLKKEMKLCINRCSQKIEYILVEMPREWKVPTYIIRNKLNEIFNPIWINDTWENFMECLNENTK